MSVGDLMDTAEGGTIHNADDACGQCGVKLDQTGDIVVVELCRPLSKQKCWQLVEIVERPARA